MSNYSIIPPEERYKQNRSKRYARQAVSQRLARDYTQHSVSKCMRHPSSDLVSVVYSPSDQKAHYSGLVTCGSVWDCPICSAKISMRRAEEIKKGLQSWIRQGGVYVMVTYTLQHTKADSLKSVKKALDIAHRALKSGRYYQEIKEDYGIKGSLVGVELTYSERNGWHYHKHELLFLKDGSRDLKQLQDRLFKKYYWLLADSGFGSIDGIGIKVSELIEEEDPESPVYISKWGLEQEITAGAEFKDSSGYTPFELLDHPEFYNLFVEYSHTMKGSRRLVWSRGMRDLLGLGSERSDQDIAEELDNLLEDYVTLVHLTKHEWRWVVRLGLRSDLLDHAERGEEVLKGFLEREVYRYSNTEIEYY